MQGQGTAGHAADERRRGGPVTELARSRRDTAPSDTRPTSASEEVA
jgi:hypothetical protein